MPDIIYKTIEQKIANNENGLFLIDAPTGYGKTFEIIKYIQKNYQNKKIFFIANQEKLLPQDKELFNNLSETQIAQMKSHLLRMKSIINTYRDNFDPDIIKIANRKEVEPIIQSINRYMQIIRDSNDNQLVEMATIRFTELEKVFRNYIKEYLKANNNELIDDWIVNLYPSVNMDKCNIILMTTKKFMFSIDPLTEKSYYMYTDRFKGSVLFIDEIDSTKKEILDIIISEANKSKIDIFRLYRKIYTFFSTNKLVDYFSEQSEPLRNCVNKYYSEINDKITDIHKQISNYDSELKELNYVMKSKDFNENKNFIFNDGDSFTISRTYDRIKYFCSLNKYLNTIEISVSEKEESIDLEKIIYLVNSMVIYFIKQTTYFVKEYSSLFNQYRNTTQENISIENSYNSIVDFMDFGYEYREFITSAIHYNLTKQNVRLSKNEEIESKLDKRLRKTSLYTEGFTYTQIVDDFNHLFETKLFSYRFDRTPEFFLMLLSQYYITIGVSATATIPTVIGNYDFDYIKDTIKCDHLLPSDEESKSIRDDYKITRIDKYENTVFEIKCIDQDFLKNNQKQTLRQFFEKNNFPNNIFNHHVQILSEYDFEDYYYEVIAMIYHCIFLFMASENSHSYIFFMNKNLNKYTKLKEIIVNTMTKIYENLEILFIDSEAYKNVDIENTLTNKDKKFFLITTYASLGTGVNLKYDLNSTKNYKDIDGVFLLEPTNIIPNLSGDSLTEENLAVYIYAIEYSIASGSITQIDGKKMIKNAFRSYLNYGSINRKGIANKDEDIAKLQKIIQALGRISRTTKKTPKIQIHTTIKVRKLILDYHENLNHIPLIREYDELTNYCLKEGVNTQPSVIIASKDSNTNKYIKKQIFGHKNNEWSLEQMKNWKELRNFVLAEPVTDLDNMFTRDLYYHSTVPIIEYKSNYRKEELPSITNSNFSISITETDCELSYLTSIDYIREYFIQNNYAITWKPGRYIMSNSLFRKIYKGVLGEIVGQIILEKSHINCVEIDTPFLYEVMDFKLCDDVYIDFKNWSPDFSQNKVDSINAQIRKNKKLKARVLFIVNIVDHGFHVINEYISKNLKIYTIPYLVKRDGEVNSDAISLIMGELDKCL